MQVGIDHNFHILRLDPESIKILQQAALPVQADEGSFFLRELVSITGVDEDALLIDLDEQALHFELQTVSLVGRCNLCPKGLGYQAKKTSSILPVGPVGYEMQCHISELH
jgi:hypothetical protein